MSGEEVAHQMTYRVLFAKEGKDWTVIAPDVHPAHSWGPNLRSATAHIKEAIHLRPGDLPTSTGPSPPHVPFPRAPSDITPVLTRPRERAEWGTRSSGNSRLAPRTTFAATEPLQGAHSVVDASGVCKRP